MSQKIKSTKKSTSTRVATFAKAGRRARAFTAPLPVNEDKLVARTLGQQQFCLREPATVEVANLMGRVEAMTVPFARCPHRKQTLFSPIRRGDPLRLRNG